MFTVQGVPTKLFGYAIYDCLVTSTIASASYIDKKSIQFNFNGTNLEVWKMIVKL